MLVTGASGGDWPHWKSEFADGMAGILSAYEFLSWACGYRVLVSSLALSLMIIEENNDFSMKRIGLMHDLQKRLITPL